jgi:hypothetical protein
MFNPTHVVNDLERVSHFAKGEPVRYMCTVEDHKWFSVAFAPHPKTGFPCSNAVYMNAEGLEQCIASFSVDEIYKEAV